MGDQSLGSRLDGIAPPSSSANTPLPSPPDEEDTFEGNMGELRKLKETWESDMFQSVMPFWVNFSIGTTDPRPHRPNGTDLFHHSN